MQNENQRMHSINLIMNKMKKNVIILIVFGLPILFACKDDTFINEQIENSQPNTSKVILDSRDVYKIQTDKSVMLNNLIRYQSGKYSLDLSEEDAEKIGISKLMYNQVLEHINQLNNSNLITK